MMSLTSMGFAAALSLMLSLVAGEEAARPRLDELRSLPRPALAERLRATSPEELIVLGREGVRRLGTYRARLMKQERVGGKVLPAQTMEVIVQPAPRAQRL